MTLHELPSIDYSLQKWIKSYPRSTIGTVGNRPAKREFVIARIVRIRKDGKPITCFDLKFTSLGRNRDYPVTVFGGPSFALIVLGNRCVDLFVLGVVLLLTKMPEIAFRVVTRACTSELGTADRDEFALHLVVASPLSILSELLPLSGSRSRRS